MSLITRRLSVAELSQQILQMAQTGVYRESIFEALAPVATKKQIRLAIAHCKQFGLHSVASLRDADLGTYYQADPVQFRLFQQVKQAAIPLDNHDNLAQQVLDTTQTMRVMLAIAGGLTIGLMAVGLVCMTAGQPQAGAGAWLGAASAASVWGLQKFLCRRLL